MVEIARPRFLVIRFGDNMVSYIAPARCGVFCDMAGAPLDQESADTMHRARMAELAAMPPQGCA